MTDFGKIKRVETPYIWPSEAIDITLGLIDTIDRLGEALGNRGMG
jgi:hypothetical protein